MGILSRHIFGELTTGAILGTVLFTFVLFLRLLGRFFEQLVTSSSSMEQVLVLFALILPQTLPFTIPVGVLTGILIAIGRMSGDGEIIALRAAGVPGRRVLVPVMFFAGLGMIVGLWASCVLTPWSTRETYRIINQIGAAQLTAEIRPRIFEEQFPNRILYVEDVVPGPVVRWRGVFMADLSPPQQRGGVERGDAPAITLAAEAIAVPDTNRNRLQLSFLNGSSFEVGKDPKEYFGQSFPQGDQALDAPPRSERKAKDFSELDMAPLWLQSSTEAKIEFHRRLALPVACVVLGLLAVPLGISTRKGGKSAAFVMTVALGFAYYMSLISMIALARQGSVPPGWGVWGPNLLFGIIAIVMLIRMERPGDSDWGRRLREMGSAFWSWLGGSIGAAKGGGLRLPLLPQLIDTYVLGSFLYYFLLLLTAFLLLTHVFTFFELLGDIITRGIPMARVGQYHLFLTPKLIYDAAPLSVLVAVLVTFGLLAKTNEITALKACGVSVYRLAVPVLVAGVVLSGALFAFDYYVVPDANLVQDAIRAEIKGRPAQTYFRPDRRWIFGRGSWIYYYKHYDADSNVMSGVSVYELDREKFRLNRHIYAEHARWDPSIQRWIFTNGWASKFDGIRLTNFDDFRGLTATYPNLNEPPSYFMKEVKQDKQMNYHQLSAYIGELRQSGVDTLRLQVQYHKKFAVPIFALIMALISTPFAYLTGNRGAMTPIGISLGIAICYWAISQLFEQMGNVGQLPAEMAAWSPDLIFSLAGIYFLMRVRT